MNILTTRGARSSSRPSKTRTTTRIAIMSLPAIVIVGAIAMLVAAPGLRPAYAVVYPYSCGTCGAHESIIGNGLGDLTCSNGITYPGTQINFNAIVPVKVLGAAKGSVTLTATAISAQIQGMVTSGAWDPSTTKYVISGTSTSDSVCGIVGSPFSISGPTGTSVPISMTGGKYDFKGIGDVKTAHAHA